MFSFFKPKEKLPPYIDMIWASSKERDVNLISHAQKLAGSGKIVLVSSFESSLKDFAQKLTAVGISHHRAQAVSDISGHHSVVLVHSKLLVPAPEYAHAKGFHVAMLEHYPMPDKDKAILRKAAIVLEPSSIVYFTSLSAPLFQLFGGNRISEMLQRLGLAENEPIEHSLISSSIKRAQEKLAKSVPFEFDSENEDEWYRINFHQ